MDIEARIQRRRRRNDGPRLVRDYDPLSPVVHVDEPSERGPVLERLLDHLDPAFDGGVPPNAYVHGPFGSGKSAVVTALFAGLAELSTETRSIIHTSTRAPPSFPEFVYLDLRERASEFAFYHGVLDALVEEPVPDHGISTAELRERLDGLLGDARAGAVVAVDHVGDPEGIDTGSLVELFAGLPSNASWIAVGRADPAETELTDYTAASIRIGRYRRQVLVDVLSTRASAGLAGQALDHELVRRIAEWAEGNAHHALAALFVAADRANHRDGDRLEAADVEAAIGRIPRRSVSLGRVLALPPNKQLVLRQLLDLDDGQRASVTATAEAISARTGVELSPDTVKRFLYEMAEAAILERVQVGRPGGKGRPPSRVETRFPPTAFRRLYDLRG